MMSPVLALALLILITFVVAHAVYSFVRPASLKPAGPYGATWRPLESVTITVAIYILSSVAASFMLYELIGRGVDLDRLDPTSTVMNFVYLLLFEGITIFLLWRFLVRRKASPSSIGIKRPRWNDAIYALGGFAAYFITVSVAEKTIPWVDFEQKQDIGFSTTVEGFGLMVVFLSLVIIVPIVEELVTRGFLYSGLRSKLNLLPAAFITCLIFSLAHLQPETGNPLLWAAAIDTFVLSVVLIGLREMTDSIIPSVMLHMLKNGLAFSFLFVIPRLS